MDQNTLRSEIHKLKPWYQNVDFGNGVMAKSSHSKLSGEYAWHYIQKLLPNSLNGKRILDLGSNAGLFCIRCAQIGAREVVGVEQESKHLRQCEFLKDYFDTQNVKFINTDLLRLMDRDIGKFDVVLAISVLYWVGRPGVVPKGTHYGKKYRDVERRFIDHITTLSDCFVVRARGKKYNNSDYYSGIFGECGFSMGKLINEDVGNHEMMLFRRS